MASVAVVVLAASPTPLMLTNSAGHVHTSFVLFDFEVAFRTHSHIFLINKEMELLQVFYLACSLLVGSCLAFATEFVATFQAVDGLFLAMLHSLSKAFTVGLRAPAESRIFFNLSAE